MSRVARRSSKARAIAAPPTTYISALTSRRSSSLAKAVSAADDLVTVHRSDTVQGALRDEDAAAAEGCWRLSNRHCAEASHVADEPEAVQEATRGNRPCWPLEVVNRGKVLGKRAQIGIVPSIPGERGLLGNRPRSGAVVGTDCKLIEEFTHDMVEFRRFAAPMGQPSQCLAEAALRWRVGGEPIGTGRYWSSHLQDRRLRLSRGRDGRGRSRRW